MTKLFLALIFLLGSALPASAATFWVNSAASGSHCVNSATDPGAASSSQTITQGLACAGAVGTDNGAGDTVMVVNGTYDELVSTIPNGTAGNYFTLKAANNRGATIRAPSWTPGAAVISITGTVHYVIIDGFVLDGRNFGAGAGFNQGMQGIHAAYGGSQANFHDVTIQNNEIKNAAASGVDLYGTNLVFRNNYIHDGGTANPGFDHACYCVTANTTFENNIMQNFAGYGMHMYDAGADTMNANTFRNNIFSGMGRAGALVNGRNTIFYNNIAYGNASPGIQVGNFSVADTLTIYSNTSYGNSAEGIYVGTASNNATLRNNIAYGNSGVPIGNDGTNTVQDHNVTTNPNFVNAAGADFHLQASSTAAIGAGADLGSSYATDFAGIPRPQGGTWDAGAYEFQSAVTVTVAITGSNLGCTLANCVVISSSIILSGTTTAVSAGAVTFSTDRGSSGSATWTPGSGYTTAAITLKAGVNNVTIRSTDASGNAGTATIAITYTPTFPGNALVASYGFEDGSGTSATDSSGNSNTGTLTNGPTWITTGRYGKALSFNGTNQYVVASGTLNNTLNLTQSFTLSAWVQPAASFTTFKSIVHKNSDPVGSPYELYASVSGNCGSGSASGFTTVNGASGPLYAACNPTPLAVGVWTHLALIYDGAQLCLYKNADNTTKVCTAATGYMEPSTGSLQIGASEFGEYFQGLIDEVRVYNFAIPLTAASNTAAGASCTPTNFSDNNAVATASITGNMNCPVINLNPPSAFKLSAGATELKLGSSATAAKIGANP